MVSPTADPSTSIRAVRTVNRDKADPWPKVRTKTDVLVIGGGVNGAATAYYLARHGIEVTLVEQGGISHRASGVNAGTLHVQIPGFYFAAFQEPDQPHGRFAEYLRATNRLYAEATAIWRGLEVELQADLGVNVCGGLMVAETAEHVAVLRRKTPYERSVGIETAMLSPTEMCDLVPGLSSRLAGGTWCPREGFANPLLVAPAFVAQAQRLGVQVRTGCRVLAIERRRDGCYIVQTTEGSISARRIVAAPGAAMPTIAAMVGLNLPVRAFPLQVAATERVPSMLHRLIQHVDRHLSLRQWPNGSFVIGGGWPGAGRNRVSLGSLHGNLAVACDVFPALRPVRLARVWSGMTTGVEPTNRIGIIGEISRLPGFYILVAGGWGFTLAPLLGRLMAELLVDGRPSLPIAPFAPEASPQ